ncbi:MAG: hypothetical protein V8R80_00750 [Eubacterium sp.]
MSLWPLRLDYLAAPYVCSGLNDLFAGIWLSIYNAKRGKLAEVPDVRKPGREN